MITQRKRFICCVAVAAVIAASCGNGSDPQAIPNVEDQPVATTSPAEDVERSTTSIAPQQVESGGAEPPPSDGGGSSSVPKAGRTGPTATVGAGAPNSPFTPILVDQFGYLIGARKVAVLVDPVQGLNSEIDYEPGPTIEVVNLDSGSVAHTGSAVPWRGGAEDPQSGDRGWRYDFSSVTEPGVYRIDDVTSGISSNPFVISDNVYGDVLRTAQRVFYFNRGNIEHVEAYAGRWATPAVAVGPGQDTEARSIDDPAAPPQDLSGGWFDAGDTNKYVTFATTPLHQLLGAYETAPGLFGDDLGIPESDNGIPDLLDEVRVELEWLRRMQQSDGGVLSKVGFAGYDGAAFNIFEDDRPRFFEEVCSSSSIAAAGMMAHGSIAFATIDPGFSADLSDSAMRAWQWFESNPRRDDCDPQVINAGDADVSIEDQAGLRFVAAVYLYAATGEDRFHQAVREGLDRQVLFPGDAFGRYDPERAEAVEFYINLPSANPNLQQSMRDLIRDLGRNANVHGYDDDASLYRSFLPDEQYHWGSNMVMANSGNGTIALARMGVEADANTERAGAHLGSLNGVNPLGLVYLSNMNELGAERSINELYHFWFANRTDYDVAWSSPIGPVPGYVVGGPNASYSGANPDVPRGPVAKTYLDDNTNQNDERPWELSEPAIYYQAAYIRLLAGVIAETPS